MDMKNLSLLGFASILLQTKNVLANLILRKSQDMTQFANQTKNRELQL